MHTIDRQILEFCLDGFRPLKSLMSSIASGTLYRHVKRLVRLGWVMKEGNLYQTTEAGRRQLANGASGLSWDAVSDIYPPLARVPTPVHRALIELILAAVAARQHEIRPDRHPFFVIFGSTLRWKTSLGRFVCHALGLDPAVQIVDCGSEAGRSLTFRRGGDGTLVSKRALLESPFLVLDEFQTADRSVRNALSILLSGRLVTPVENEQLIVRPVPLLTLNPQDAATLERRLGLSAPLIRRALLANLDAIPMPDLAALGERAVDAARGHAPLTLGEPRTNFHSFHKNIVDLVRDVLVADAHERVDVEIIANLAAGMTALIPEPVAAIAQVVHGVAVLAETLSWARPGWIEVVSDFRRGSRRPATGTSVLVRVAFPETQARDTGTKPAVLVVPTAPASVSLAVPAPPAKRRTSVPDLDLSDEMRAKLIWFAMETGRDVEGALTTLLGLFLKARAAGRTIETLATILHLGEQLEVVEVDVETLHDYLHTLEQLQKKNCDFEDVPEALRLISYLEALPLSWTWGQAELALQAVAAILEAGITLRDVHEFLEHHQRLQALGFEEATAVALGEALTRAGATGDHRDAVLAALVDIAGQQVDVEALKAEHQRLDAAAKRLRAEEKHWATVIQKLREQVAGFREAVRRLTQTRDSLQAECDEAAGGLAIVEALRAFLIGRTAEAERLWASFEALRTWRVHGGRVDDSVGQMWTRDIRQKIFEFFQKLLQDLQKS